VVGERIAATHDERFVKRGVTHAINWFNKG
jgi:hypothetical protein